MSVSDDAMLIASSDSFWEPGNYKRTTKRIEDGHRLCNDLMNLIQDRGEIEKNYAKSLREWSKKWNSLIEKGPEYGTTEAAWKAVLTEADRVCDLHIQVKDKLLNEVFTDIKKWQKDNYHKTMMHLKEKKEMDDAFKKAQKPWAKILAKVNKAKSDYHAACKNERSAINQERNAVSDSSVSSDNKKKIEERVQKCKEEREQCRDRYEMSLDEINKYNAKYMEDMTEVFERCQEFEMKRLDYFKQMLFSIHDCINLSEDTVFRQIYKDYYQTIKNGDGSQDLKWWSNNSGVGMAMNWPTFEEYSEEMREIARSGKRGTIADSSIQLMGINQQRYSEEFSEYSPEFKNISKKIHKEAPRDSITLTSIHQPKNETIRSRNNKFEPQPTQRESITQSPKKPYNPFEEDENEEEEKEQEKNESSVGGANPFEDDHEDWDEYTQDTGEPGIPVRALYDYDGAESDELTFKQGNPSGEGKE